MRYITKEEVISTVLDYFGLYFEDIIGSNHRFKAEKRQIVMYFCLKYARERKHLLTQKKVGEIFGLDHATVIHARNKVEDYCSVDKSYKEDIEAIDNQLKELKREYDIYNLSLDNEMEIDSLLNRKEILEAELTSINMKLEKLTLNTIEVSYEQVG